MKAGIHPDYHEITVTKPNGDQFTTFSTYKQEGAELKLDISIENHSAWKEGATTVNKKEQSVAKFNDRYGALGNFGFKAEEDK